MPAPKKAVETAVLEVPALNLHEVVLHIEGLSELIVHAWSEKAKAEMRAKQFGEARQKKAPKSPKEDYEAAFHRDAEGNPALPTIAFKAAMVSAATQVSGLTKTFLRGAFHTIGEYTRVYGEPYMREDMVRIGMGTADLRYRPGFPEWRCHLRIRYNTRGLTIEQLVSLANQAGFSTGVAEWRPEKDGLYGMFHVTGVDDAARWDEMVKSGEVDPSLPVTNMMTAAAETIAAAAAAERS